MTDHPAPQSPLAPRRHRLPKAHRLKSKKLLDALFAPGGERPNKAWPLLMKVVEADLVTHSPTQAAFSVSKRRFARAVDRNQIKRHLREAWRHERHDLEEQLEKLQKQWAIVFIFVGHELPDAKRCRKAMRKLTAQAVQQLTPNTD